MKRKLGPMARHTRFSHTIPRTKWGRVAAVLAVVLLGVIAVVGFSVTNAGERGKLASASGSGQFIIQCHGPNKVGMFDPIVAPGQQMFGHQHEFFANTSINPDSNYLSLYRGTTTCDAAGDTASYWAPSLFVSGQRIPAKRLTAYYNADTTAVETFPAGLKMIAGNKLATSPQSTKVVYWGCGNGSGISTVNYPPQCGGGGELTLHVIFPNCWDGKHLDSTDHQSHMSYSNGTSCDSAHPHLLPTLTDRFEYGITPDPKTVTIAGADANGMMVTTASPNRMHADFWNTWDIDRLDRIVKHCINGGIQCSAAEAISAQGPAHPK